VLAADLQVARDEGVLITAENRVELSRSRLALRMGLSGERTVVPAQGDIPVPPGSVPPLPESVNAAWEKRPDIRARGALIHEREAAVSAARAEFAPTFFGQGGYVYDSNAFNPNPNTFSLLFGGRINLFAGFSDEAAKREALLGVERRKEELALLRDEVALSVKRAHLGVIEAEKKKAIAEVAVGQAEENLRIQNNRYREGLAISTEVLDAQTLLTQAKVALSNATFDLFESRYSLLVERGELLAFLEPLLAPASGHAWGRCLLGFSVHGFPFPLPVPRRPAAYSPAPDHAALPGSDSILPSVPRRSGSEAGTALPSVRASAPRAPSAPFP